jgi:hypothetical protein
MMGLALLTVWAGSRCRDGLFDEALLWMMGGGEHTEYADGFSEERFRRIRAGDSEASVRAALGEPLSVHTIAAKKFLTYSRSPSSTHFRLRVVVVEGGVVKEVASFVFID